MILEPDWIHVQWRTQVENVWVFPYFQIGKAELGPEINVIISLFTASPFQIKEKF